MLLIDQECNVVIALNGVVYPTGYVAVESDNPFVSETQLFEGLGVYEPDRGLLSIVTKGKALLSLETSAPLSFERFFEATSWSVPCDWTH